ncbi:phage shock protein B [Fontimonas thermophila]|uniref:Phage shock protein B n=1 Tax=Fontimonas thermophila TaxID=1076937 RepID=A0A1I2HVA4_9GAMM|nr:envelope stress response membrane protein PspB [Fontimonas thermophila]SFF33333.1 phage shock protein B [Fontimonas thermophila]
MEALTEELVPLVAIICIFVIMPGMVMYFIYAAVIDRRRHQRDAQTASASAHAELIALAERMEQRIEALEQILDAESPGWRNKYHDRP